MRRLRDAIDDWWRVDPAGVVYLIGFLLAIPLAALTVALVARA